MPSTLTQNVPAEAIPAIAPTWSSAGNRRAADRATPRRTSRREADGLPSTIAVTTVTPGGEVAEHEAVLQRVDRHQGGLYPEGHLASTAVARCPGDGQGRAPSAHAHVRDVVEDHLMRSVQLWATVAEQPEYQRAGRDGVRVVRQRTRYRPVVRQAGGRGQAAGVAAVEPGNRARRR